MHIKRKEKCRKHFGKELVSMELEQEQQRKQYLRKYQQSNKEAVKKKDAKHYKTNSEAILEKFKHKRRAAKNELEPKSISRNTKCSGNKTVITKNVSEKESYEQTEDEDKEKSFNIIVN